MRHELIFVGLILATGCSGAIDVGPGNAAGGPGAYAGAGNTAGGGNTVPGALACKDETPLPTWPSPSGCTSGSNLPIVGTWHGYIENQVAPWDDLTLVVNGASVAGGLCGTLTVGVGSPPAPATDPSVGYPDPNAAFIPYTPPRILPGFVLTLLNGTTDGTRVRFSVAQTEPWKGWCELQTSYDAGGGPSCDCLPNWGAQETANSCALLDPSGTNRVVNCGQLALCGGFGETCKCNHSGCTANLAFAGVAFDLRFAGDEAEGSATSAHFIRVP